MDWFIRDRKNDTDWFIRDRKKWHWLVYKR